MKDDLNDEYDFDNAYNFGDPVGMPPMMRTSGQDSKVYQWKDGCLISNEIDTCEAIYKDLKAARGRIERKSNWIQGERAINNHGDSLIPNSCEASKWCLEGSILANACGRICGVGYFCEECAWHCARDYLIGIIRKHTDFSTISAFNDNVRTRHSDVLNILDKAIGAVKDRLSECRGRDAPPIDTDGE